MYVEEQVAGYAGAAGQADAGPALQDQLKVHCFGCGALNAHGLHIKSRWVGDELVCRWRPQPFHIGHPGLVYGGTIASIVDCHAIWAAMGTACRQAGHDLAGGPPPFAFVTGKLSVSYLRPAAIDGALELYARVQAQSDRKYLVSCRVLQHGAECATAEVLTIRVKGLN